MRQYGEPSRGDLRQAGRGDPRRTLDVENLDLDYYGPLFEKHEAFPEKINTHFCKALYDNPESLEDSRTVKVLHWERGGKDLACGTGACPWSGWRPGGCSREVSGVRAGGPCRSSGGEARTTT